MTKPQRRRKERALERLHKLLAEIEGGNPRKKDKARVVSEIDTLTRRLGR